MRFGRIIALACVLHRLGHPCFSQTQKDTSKCVSVKRVLELLGYYNKSRNSYPQSQIITLIKDRGFCGRPTPSELDGIKRENGSPELLAAIDAATRETENTPSPVPTEVEVKQPKQGRLQVLCRPVDCRVSVDGKDLGETKGGEYSAPHDVGLLTVRADLKDYDVNPKVQNVEVKDAETTAVTFNLTVSRAALETAGERLFARTLEALGGPDGLKTLSFFKAAGTLNCYDRAGQPTAWGFSAIVKSPDKAKFELSIAGSKLKYEAATTERGLEWNKTDDKNLALFRELDFSLRRFEEQQIARTIGALRNGGFKMIASELTAKPGDDAILRAEGGGQVYRITIGSDMRPRELFLESGGLDKGLKVQYSEYVEREGTAYPMHMEIQYPDAERHGVAVSLRSVELNPSNVKDADLALTKKGKTLGLF